jgi:SHS2 domain-containing protein
MSRVAHTPTARPPDPSARVDPGRFAVGTGHRIVDHTSELELEIWAPDWPALLCEAGRALAAISLRGTPPRPEGPTYHLEATSRDREALLVDWLNELLYRSEAELWVACEFGGFEATDTHLATQAWGMRVDEAPAVVKAATLHCVAVRQAPTGLSARVILDV